MIKAIRRYMRFQRRYVHDVPPPDCDCPMCIGQRHRAYLLARIDTDKRIIRRLLCERKEMREVAAEFCTARASYVELLGDTKEPTP